MKFNQLESTVLSDFIAMSNSGSPSEEVIAISSMYTSGTCLASLSVDGKTYEIFSPTIAHTATISVVSTYDDISACISTAVSGDAYYNLADGQLYVFDGHSFQDEGNGIGAKIPAPKITISGSEPNYASIVAHTSTASAGDSYLNLADGLLYIFDGTKFPDDGHGVAFKGDKGDKGDDGLTPSTDDIRDAVKLYVVDAIPPSPDPEAFYFVKKTS